ncbi:peroxin [Steccherinum ochraceum]|uniref:Peroxin n=1 Tax=Steccherinum ochraceum TaxID=92696 RepID=A0A4R0R3N5_9APHY|nr:peroxin [Steccherinum ochraceum]
MLTSLGAYFYERRRGLTKIAGYAGGAYAVSKYVAQRLGEVRDGMVQDRLARDNLRRRFEQNQQDISFTIMALLPSLGQHILDGMDVEGVTQELQSYSRSSGRPTEHQPHSDGSMSSSLELQSDSGHDARSEVSSMSMISRPEDSSSQMAGSSHSWVDQFSAGRSSAEHSQTASTADSDSHQDGDSPKPNHGPELSDSIVTSTDSSAMSYEESTKDIPAVIPTIKTKAELWREVKILTFTRTLTTLYSMTLLSLFTHIQLSILGRHKYVQSVLQQARDEQMHETVQDSFSITQLIGGGPSLDSCWVDDDLQDVEAISEETERKFLTLSWWILHVGWKDVGERVRRGVEEVFESVSLKTKLSAAELHRLVSDVRRRVEYEVTFEGKERRINFMSTLLPPTPETLQHVLTQGGIPSRLAAAPDAGFRSLLAETRTHLASSDLQRVLEVCLDHSTEALFNGLEKNVFFDNSMGLEETSPSGLGLVPESRVRLAGMLPGLARWCRLALEGLPNELIDGLAAVREVSAFSAIIYSSYEDQFR